MINIHTLKNNVQIPICNFKVANSITQNYMMQQNKAISI